MLHFILSAVASPSVLLAPADKWVIDYADHQCTATRVFGDKADPVFLVIKPSPTSEVVQLILAKKGRETKAVQYRATLTIGNTPPNKVAQLNFGSKQSATRLVNLPAGAATTLSRGDSIVWEGHGTDVRLATGNLGQVMKALAHCRSDLRNFWNISPQKAEKLKSMASPEKPLMSYFSTEDYPQQAVWQLDSGQTSVVALVDEKGTVQECMVDETSGIATLDAMTCAVIRERAKFKPGIGSDGNPVRSYFMQKVRWKIPW